MLQTPRIIEPRAGPMNLAMLNCAASRAIPLSMSSGGTRSGTIDLHAGKLKTNAMPIKVVRTMIRASDETPRLVAMARPSAASIMITCVTMMSLRLSTRSASEPAYRTKNRMGRKVDRFTAPTHPFEPVSSFTYQSRTAVCIQVPTFERKAPDHSSRKSRYPKAESTPPRNRVWRTRSVVGAVTSASSSPSLSSRRGGPPVAGGSSTLFEEHQFEERFALLASTRSGNIDRHLQVRVEVQVVGLREKADQRPRPPGGELEEVERVDEHGVAKG